MYTSGQLAKKCQVTLRTVQYYDKQGLLAAKRTASDRRMYDDTQVQRLNLILTYKELGFTLKDIKQLLDTKESTKILQTMLARQQAQNEKVLIQAKKRAAELNYLAKNLADFPVFPGNLARGVTINMENAKHLRNLRLKMVIIGILIDVILWGSVIYVILTGHSWWLIGGAIGLTLLLVTGLVRYYYRRVAYICPNCHFEFNPSYREFFWSAHTPRTRKLTCPNCHQTSFCPEIYAKK
ncbi:MerR family transcriptional regulator [Ligilactobacillus apodemi]|uniref:Transcriptional regulator n=1 Tax=Ligilactobacillus apodemi DSM 16634 = JCM 16172 TaxID=1423724 RepID=A0A0R1U1Z8_9LACO|nr:MerR family transcriptional regulator [Ligilactobacillus apodemi]KRL87376.1 transcriptional regulator [Ligilactobacillus apodemi DSM 16634 = JCM 16172]MCR1901691.1 MerR family transcriptional regulator [Ligilactobacillus apodemi]